MSSPTKQLIVERNSAQRKARESGNHDDWNLFKQLWNRVNSILKVEKTEWHKDKLSTGSRNSGEMWKNVKGWLGWNTSVHPSSYSMVQIYVANHQS